MHILMYNRPAYIQADLNEALLKAGVTLSTFTHEFQDKNVDEEFSHDFLAELKSVSYDAVFSVNYYPVIADVCHKANVKYISWSYDAPLNVRKIEETLGYSTNYVFLFDKLQTAKYINMGFQNIFHLPLAVNVERLNKIIPSANERAKYGSDISFVGSMYNSVYNQLIEPLPDYMQGYLDGLCESQLRLYGCFFLDEMIHADLLSAIEDVYAITHPQAGFKIIKEELSYTMATQITHLERERLFFALSSLDNANIHLYSGNTVNLPEHVKQPGPVSYDTQMPLVFKNSKINLNITLKCLQSGIPLRALDIMGCGGFLLSNYQPELEEYFINGQEFVSYGSIDEAVEIANYYLKHEDERLTIANKGYEKVAANYTYKKQLAKIFALAGLE